MNKGKQRKHILIVDDEQITLRALREEFSAAGYVVTTACDGQTALEQLVRQHFHLLFLDMHLPRKSGMEVLRECRIHAPDTLVVIITAYASVETAVDAMRMGAADYITKPYNIDDLLARAERLLAAASVLEPKASSPEGTNLEFLGSDPQIQNIRRTVERVRSIPTSVILTGESGTGKGILAKQIHYTGARAKRPFIHINCAAIPENLMESEIFGHERGSFTGASQTQKGKFELAEEGTIFLDEIGLLPLNLQSKLLNVLQERTFERVGGSQSIPLKARIISATNEDLERAVAEGRFREDLYFRLNVIRIDIPPLRFRKGDIPALAEMFLARFQKKLDKRVQSIDPTFCQALMRYDWPGNVRELENALESAVALSGDGPLTPDALPMRITQQIADYGDVLPPMPKTVFKTYLEQQEANAIRSALKRFGGHRGKTAEYLGISKRTLQYKLKNLGLTGQE